MLLPLERESKLAEETKPQGQQDRSKWSSSPAGSQEASGEFIGLRSKDMIDLISHIRSKSIASIDSLDSFEYHQHLHLVHSSITIVIAGLEGLSEAVPVVGGSHSHSQAEISVSTEELLSFQLA